MWAKLSSLCVSVLIIGALFYSADFSRLVVLFSDVNVWYLGWALFLFVPTILIPALRWQYILSDQIRLSTLESVRLILAGSTLNMFLPAKAGDLLKAFFVETHAAIKKTEQSQIVARAVYEKAMDLVGLSVNLWIGWFFLLQNQFVVMMVFVFSVFVVLVFLVLHMVPSLPGVERMARAAIIRKIFILLQHVHGYARQMAKEPVKLVNVLLVSVVLWFVHLLQFYFFFKMFGLSVGLTTVFANMAVAIYIGLLPLTIGGIGTRDAAVVYLLSGQVGYNVCLAIGLMGTVRYIVPAAFGSFFVFGYVKRLGRFWKRLES